MDMDSSSNFNFRLHMPKVRLSRQRNDAVESNGLNSPGLGMLFGALFALVKTRITCVVAADVARKRAILLINFHECGKTLML